MKLRVLGEADISTASGFDGGGSFISGTNTSVGSNVVNYGPNNPYLSNLAEYERRKKNKKDDLYERDYKKKDNKSAGHSRKNVGKNKIKRFHEPEGW